MQVPVVRLHHFRNYRLQEVRLEPGLTALWGDNGQGKTNLLEALCVLSCTRSPLADRDRELLLWGSTEAGLGAEIELPGGRRRQLQIRWHGAAGGLLRRDLVLDGEPCAGVLHWLGVLPLVSFFPADLELLTGEPAGRRRFLNLELGQSRPTHLSQVARYRRALKQRNSLLRAHLEALRRSPRNPPPGPAGVSEWTRQLVVYGTQVHRGRADFVAELAPLAREMHQRLSGLPGLLEMRYLPGLPGAEGSLPESEWGHRLQGALEQSYAEDVRRGTTRWGPHRDDLQFLWDGMDLRRYGSQGQQRLGVLAIKLALAHWVRQTTEVAPLLVLDDALSELDAVRRERLLQEAGNFPQVMVTTTDRSLLQGVPAHYLRVHAGTVEQE